MSSLVLFEMIFCGGACLRFLFFLGGGLVRGVKLGGTNVTVLVVVVVVVVFARFPASGAASEYTSDVCLVYTSPANETDWATCGPKCLAGTHISTFPDPKSQRPGMCVDNGCSAGSDEGVRYS